MRGRRVWQSEEEGERKKNKTFTRAFRKSSRCLNEDEIRKEAHKRHKEMRDAPFFFRLLPVSRLLLRARFCPYRRASAVTR